MIEGLFIREASITNAKIGDLEVDTVKIKGNAVSLVYSATNHDDTELRRPTTVSFMPRSETSSFQVFAYRKGDVPQRHVNGANPGALFVDFSDDGGNNWGNIFGLVNTYFFEWDRVQNGNWVYFGPTTLIEIWKPGVVKPLMLRVRDENGGGLWETNITVTELAK